MPKNVSDIDSPGDSPGLGPGTDYHLLTVRPLPWQLFRCANEPVNERWQDARILDGQWRVYAVDRPGVSLTYSGGDLEYPAEALMVIPAWLPFTFRFRTRAVHAFIHFELPTCGRPLTQHLWPHPWIWRDQHILRRFRRLAREMTVSPELDDRARQQLLALEAQALTASTVAEAIGHLAPNDQVRLIPGANDRLAPVLARIEADLAGSLTIADLAVEIGLAEESLIRLFHRIHGQTPTQFIIERRCSRAAQLLLETTRSLDDIASSCGFGSRHYFSRMFSRQHGLAPAAFRRRGRNPPLP